MCCGIVASEFSVAVRRPLTHALSIFGKVGGRQIYLAVTQNCLHTNPVEYDERERAGAYDDPECEPLQKGTNADLPESLLV